MWEKEHRVPIRVRGTEDGGGAPGPSTIQGECEPVPKTERKMNFFPLPLACWARRCTERRIA